MVGIVDTGAKDQEPASDLAIIEMAARAEHLQPAVIVDELLAEIGCGVSLAPMEVVAALFQQTRQRTGLFPGDGRRAAEMDEARQSARLELSRRHRPVDVSGKAADGLLPETAEESPESRKQFVENRCHTLILAKPAISPLGRSSDCAGASLV
jgi:hypothetical protein